MEGNAGERAGSKVNLRADSRGGGRWKSIDAAQG
jgi:hypothetical protein